MNQYHLVLCVFLACASEQWEENTVITKKELDDILTFSPGPIFVEQAYGVLFVKIALAFVVLVFLGLLLVCVIRKSHGQRCRLQDRNLIAVLCVLSSLLCILCYFW